MSRFLWAIRNTYNTKRLVFVLALFASIIFLLFAPFHLVGADNFYTMFEGWLSFNEIKADVESGSISEIQGYLGFGLSLSFLLFALVGILISIKIKPFCATIIPFCVYALFNAIVYAMVGPHTPPTSLYSAFYAIICLLVILAVALILLALYLPLKEPKPREPRKRNPSKAQRIAELEARVHELEKESRD